MNQVAAGFLDLKQDIQEGKVSVLASLAINLSISPISIIL